MTFFSPSITNQTKTVIFPSIEEHSQKLVDSLQEIVGQYLADKTSISWDVVRFKEVKNLLRLMAEQGQLSQEQKSLVLSTMRAYFATKGEVKKTFVYTHYIPIQVEDLVSCPRAHPIPHK